MSPGRESPIEERKKEVLSLFSETLATKYFGFKPSELDKGLIRATKCLFKKSESRKLLITSGIKMPSKIQKEKQEQGEVLKIHPLFNFNPDWVYDPKDERPYIEEILDLLTEIEDGEPTLGYLVQQSIDSLDDYKKLGTCGGCTTLGNTWKNRYNLREDVGEITALIINKIQKPVIQKVVLKLVLYAVKAKETEIKEKTEDIQIVRR